jgi:hypothetical protein
VGLLGVCDTEEVVLAMVLLEFLRATSQVAELSTLVGQERGIKDLSKLALVETHRTLTPTKASSTIMTIPVPGTYIIYNIQYSTLDVDLHWSNVADGAPVVGFIYNESTQNMLVGANVRSTRV